MNQSFSFRMLNKWIEDSESKIVPMKSKKDEEDEREKEKEKTTIRKSEGIFLDKKIKIVKNMSCIILIAQAQVILEKEVV